MIIADVDLELLRGKDRAFHEWLDWKLEQVRQEEREACAKVCDEGAGAYVNSDYTKGLVHGARLCAAAIRSRSSEH